MLYKITDKMLEKKKPCQTPGCGYPNWHVCIVGKPDLFPQLLREDEKVTPKRERQPFTDLHLANIREANKERWAREKAEQAGRDKKIVARYARGDIGIRALCKEFGMGGTSVRRILHEAAARGEIEIRPRGLTIRDSTFH